MLCFPIRHIGRCCCILGHAVLLLGCQDATEGRACTGATGREAGMMTPSAEYYTPVRSAAGWATGTYHTLLVVWWKILRMELAISVSTFEGPP